MKTLLDCSAVCLDWLSDLHRRQHFWENCRARLNPDWLNSLHWQLCCLTFSKQFSMTSTHYGLRQPELKWKIHFRTCASIPTFYTGAFNVRVPHHNCSSPQFRKCKPTLFSNRRVRFRPSDAVNLALLSTVKKKKKNTNENHLFRTCFYSNNFTWSYGFQPHGKLPRTKATS